MAACAKGKGKKNKRPPWPLLLVEWYKGGGGGAKRGKEGRMEGSLPLRAVISVRRALHYVRGTPRCPKSWMEPFPLLDGRPSGKAEPVLLMAPLEK